MENLMKLVDEVNQRIEHKAALAHYKNLTDQAEDREKINRQIAMEAATEIISRYWGFLSPSELAIDKIEVAEIVYHHIQGVM